jgi:hypothetical protein
MKEAISKLANWRRAFLFEKSSQSIDALQNWIDAEGGRAGGRAGLAGGRAGGRGAGGQLGWLGASNNTRFLKENLGL